VSGTPGARVRVLHVITRLEPGGAQRNTLYTVAHLDRERFAPGLAWGPGDPLDERAAGIDDLARFPVDGMAREVCPARDLVALAGLREAVRRFEPAVVHTHSSKAGVLGRLAARLEAVPVVVHSIHGFGFTPLQPLPVRALFFLAERVAARWTDHFVAVSERNLQLGVELGLFPAERASLIRSGIDLERFRARPPAAGLRRQLDLPDGAPVVTQIGNFKPQKAPLDFVRLAARVAREVPEARFVMLGEGPLRRPSEELATELGVAGRMRFCGWRDDVPELLAASRVTVLTSRHEGLPRAAVESLAAGVPVVATAVDGTPEVVRHGVNGFLARPGDVEELARAVIRLLTRPATWQRCAEAAGRGLEEFDVDRMVSQQEELYLWLSGCGPF